MSETPSIGSTSIIWDPNIPPVDQAFITEVPTITERVGLPVDKPRIPALDQLFERFGFRAFAHFPPLPKYTALFKWFFSKGVIPSVDAEALRGTLEAIKDPKVAAVIGRLADTIEELEDLFTSVREGKLEFVKL